MKFKFCGDLDAPDWILKEIAIISKLSSVKVRLICSQLVNLIASSEIDYEKVLKYFDGASLDVSDTKAALAALRFILNNAAKYDVEESALANELGQLGMPKEHGDAICKAFREGKDKMRETLKKQILHLPRFQSLDYRVDFIVSSDKLQDASAPGISLQFHSRDQDGTSRSHAFEISEDKFKLLLSDLKQARAILETVE